MSLPYYFEVPELKLPFDVLQYVDDEKVMKADDRVDDGNHSYVDKLKRQEATSMDAGWYMRAFGNTGGTGQGGYGETLSDATGMSEEQHPDMSKIVREWANDLLNIRMTSCMLLRTLPGKDGYWHCEGPQLRSRRCALNFLVEGNIGKTSAQWGYNRSWGNLPPEQVELQGYVKKEDADNIEILDEYESPELNTGFFYNTMYLHRGTNSKSDIRRSILSISVAESVDIQGVYKLYQAGKLFK